jgi:lipid-A-disaccharide synthase
MNALIVAGETSGDLYGARLAASLKKRIPDLLLSGMGGDEMNRAGVELLYHHKNVSVVGVFEVASKLKHLKEASRLLQDWVIQNKPEFAVLIDFPDFNFRLARFLKKQRVKIFYYISPQLWAWRKNRIHFLKGHVDLMISVLPFEERLYRDAGVPVVYTGHPLVEMVNEEVSREPVYPKGSVPLIGIMAGSRDVEIRRHLPVLTETISAMRQRIQLEAVSILAPSIAVEKYEWPQQVRLIKENRYAAMKSCDLMLVASGTSTLEAAILNTPLFIVYRVGNISWQIGKLLVRVPYYGLVNWIAGKKVIPEYMQEKMNPALLAQDAVDFLQNEERRSKMKADLAGIVAALGPAGAIERAVDAILQRLS